MGDLRNTKLPLVLVTLRLFRSPLSMSDFVAVVLPLPLRIPTLGYTVSHLSSRTFVLSFLTIILCRQFGARSYELMLSQVFISALKERNWLLRVEYS
jgi:hypothetical protein